jgi:tetratricopeptide (TPR) repeat protein
MNTVLEHDIAQRPATAGDIAVINFQSTREGAWYRFWRTPDRPGLTEYIVEQEGLALAFLGDCCALDRMALLVEQLVRVDDGAIRTVLIQAQVASARHCFIDARRYLAQARLLGAPVATIERLSLGVDQALGTRPDEVLAARRRIAAQTRQLEDLVRLGSLLADLGHFDDADQVYRDALRGYQDVSPFALAWVCFQLGVLWGELVPARQSDRAALWYRKAVAYLPAYVKARVHLAEIYVQWRPRSALAPRGCLGCDGQARGRGQPARCGAARLREPAGQAPACLRGSRCCILCRQRQRSQKGRRAG